MAESVNIKEERRLHNLIEIGKKIERARRLTVLRTITRGLGFSGTSIETPKAVASRPKTAKEIVRKS